MLCYHWFEIAWGTKAIIPDMRVHWSKHFTFFGSVSHYLIKCTMMTMIICTMMTVITKTRFYTVSLICLWCCAIHRCYGWIKNSQMYICAYGIYDCIRIWTIINSGYDESSSNKYYASIYISLLYDILNTQFLFFFPNIKAR